MAGDEKPQSSSQEKKSHRRSAGIEEMPDELKGWNIYREEGFKEKFLRKTKENPFVPVGLMATAAVLTLGLVQFRKGDRHKSQIMMRMRIAAQGFTVAAIIVGVAINARQTWMAKK